MGKNVVVSETALPPIGGYTVHMTISLIRDEVIEFRLDLFHNDPTLDTTDLAYFDWEVFEDIHQRYDICKEMYCKVAQNIFDEAFHGADEIRKFTGSEC